MKHLNYVGLFLLLALLALPRLALSDTGADWSFSDANAHRGQFLAGMASGILVHELGHVAVAESKGYSVGLDRFSIVYPHAEMSPADDLQVSSAGFQAQWLLSEAVLRAHESKHGTEKMPTYQAGLVCSHLAITAAYLLVLRDEPTSDVTGIAHATGLSRGEVCAMVALPAALDYYRLTGRHVPTWVPTLSASIKGVGIAETWRF